MRILIVSATSFELAAVKEAFSTCNNHEIEALVTGVGMVATSFSITQKLATEKFDLAINIGIAGAFDKTLELGEVVDVVRDQFSEELVEDGEELKTYQEIGLQKGSSVYNSTFEIPQLGKFSATSASFKKVEGVTVNTVHGNENSIKAVVKRLNPQIESMEGAAFFYVCNQMKIPALQIRAISNYVEKRNLDAWKIKLALNNLAEASKIILSKL
jgi:futalosine hydrolase